METKEFKFKESVVYFEISDKNVMVNATQMAKTFNEDINHFTRLDSTKKFIEACLKTPDVGFLNVEKEEDLIISKQKTGTWMHRILAIKFAAWLDPFFEVWVYSTIDELLFGSYKEDEESLRKIARIQSDITKKEDELKNNSILKEIEALKKSEASEKRKLELRKKIKISNYRTVFSEEEMSGK
jgi:hypothetical protein